MNRSSLRPLARPVLVGTAALTVLATAGWAADTWPEVKYLATTIAIGVLAALCSLTGLVALVLHLFDGGHSGTQTRASSNAGSEPPGRPHSTTLAPQTRGLR